MSTPRVFSFTATGNTGSNADKLPALLAPPKVHPPPPKGLTAAQTRAALKRAAEVIRPHADENATGCEYQGHRQQTEPGKFVELSPKTVRWHLDDFMDATNERNSEHLALLTVGTDVLLLRRTEARDNWPHVTIENVEVDPDRTPFLTWKQKPTGSDSPGAYAVRVLDLQSRTELLLEENSQGSWDAYRAFNLRQLLKVGGVRRLRLKYYYLGVKSVGKESITAAPGDFIVLDFLRAESE